MRSWIASERKGALCPNTLASSGIKIGLTPLRAGWSSLGSLGTSHPFGRRSEGTDLPRNRSAENVRLRVGPYPRTMLITSNPTVVSGRFSCNTRTPKAYVFTTTTRIGIKRDPAKRLRSSPFMHPELCQDVCSWHQAGDVTSVFDPKRTQKGSAALNDRGA